MSSQKAIVFDVVGTLVCYGNVYETMEGGDRDINRRPSPQYCTS